jgi:predicted AAA+ superfamily ATPase
MAHFRTEEAEVFFGRGRQTRDLWQRLTEPDSAGILLLYGQTGVGKSSLLEAGLAPRLAWTHEIVTIRRDGQKGLADQLAMARSRVLAEQGRQESQEKPATIILDQVEEAFTRFRCHRRAGT